ncbi:hypothetical protein AZI11_04245 [Levilactobacillus brevis]|uniref:hypothetical protein n=1 Tax=Levilactobacillus brevis TaxID=1580 RepID=UPI000A208AA6|nr:hypothetical protein [Levilactobacillus brevis]ARN92175.1 hypothetical protein AZI11_04245 [Levilactobacillus brevis]ARN94869.1 hypothetical protein AZI12_04270 [Levilactobacillus brevis]
MHFDFKYAFLENSFLIPFIILIALQKLFPNENNRFFFVELALILLALLIYYWLFQRPFIQKNPSFKSSNRYYDNKLNFYLKLLGSISIIAFFAIGQGYIGFTIMLLVWFLNDGFSKAKN